MSKLSRYFHPGYLFPILFFAILLLIGIIIRGDYGVSWDEPVQHDLGLATWDYVTGKNSNFFSNENCYLNPFIALLETLPQKVLHEKSQRAIYLSWHLFNFIFCWIGLIFFYLLALRIFKDYRFALLSCLLFLLTPRLFAHCFYNSKDMPFLSLFVVCIYFFVRWLEHASWSNIIWMATASGMVTGARVAGIFFPLIFFLSMLIFGFTKKWERKHLVQTGVYFLLYPVAVYIFYPVIWHDPFTEFFKAIELYTHHPFNVISFFMGKPINSIHTPWYYTPVWMAIIVPLGWWIFFIAGVAGLIVLKFRNPKSFPRHWTVILLWFVLPLATEIALHSSTYDDGRHLFFIYPAMLLIATEGFRTLIYSRLSKIKFIRFIGPAAAWLIFLSTTTYLFIFMIRYHPHQYVYFNAIGRKYESDYFEKDYWGLSYRDALEFLVKYDSRPQIKVNWRVDPGEWNLIWLNEYDRNRIKLDRHRGVYEYYITNYRGIHPEDISNDKIYDLKVQGTSIMAIYKMPVSADSTGRVIH